MHIYLRIVCVRCVCCVSYSYCSCKLHKSLFFRFMCDIKSFPCNYKYLLPSKPCKRHTILSQPISPTSSCHFVLGYAMIQYRIVNKQVAKHIESSDAQIPQTYAAVRIFCLLETCLPIEEEKKSTKTITIKECAAQQCVHFSATTTLLIFLPKNMK